MLLSIDQAQSPSVKCPAAVQQCGFSEEKCEQSRLERTLASEDKHTHTGVVYLPVLGKGGRAFYMGPGLFLPLCLEQSQTLTFHFIEVTVGDQLEDHYRHDGDLKVALGS